MMQKQTPTVKQWLGLLAITNTLAFTGGWGFSFWADRFANDPLLAGGWMATCGGAVVVGSVSFSVLLTLSGKIGQINAQ